MKLMHKICVYNTLNLPVLSKIQKIYTSHYAQNWLLLMEVLHIV